jgi:hypothetical protein
MIVKASDMSCSILSDVVSLDDFAADGELARPVPLLAVVPASCENPAIDRIKTMKSVAIGEKWRVTNTRSPLDY